MLIQRLLISFLILFSFNSYSYVELGLNYSFRQQIIDDPNTIDTNDPKRSISTTKTYGFNWAWYIWEYTALEINYSESYNTVNDNREVDSSDGSITFTNVTSNTIQKVQGLGLRQSFANRKARFIPSLSIGYARLTTSGETEYEFTDSGTPDTVSIAQEEQIFDSAYVALQLRFRFTQLMGITLLGKTVMPDFDTSQLSNNVVYSAGFSWVF
jgi:hypothetical protein